MSAHHGALRKGNKEWGRKARKEEDDLRGLNARARRQHIEEQRDDEELGDG